MSEKQSRFIPVESNMGVLFVHNHDTLNGKFKDFQNVLSATLGEDRNEATISVPNPNYPDEYSDFIIKTRVVAQTSLINDSIISTPHTAIEIYASEDYLAEKTNRSYTTAPASMMKHVLILAVYGDVDGNPTMLAHTQRELSILKNALGISNDRSRSVNTDIVDVCEEVFNKVIARI